MKSQVRGEGDAAVIFSGCCCSLAWRHLAEFSGSLSSTVIGLQESQVDRGEYMITATPTRQIKAPATSYLSGRNPRGFCAAELPPADHDDPLPVVLPGVAVVGGVQLAAGELVHAGVGREGRPRPGPGRTDHDLGLPLPCSAWPWT